jgi:glycosyltransferase involved in cell wall biosynthesis
MDKRTPALQVDWPRLERVVVVNDIAEMKGGATAIAMQTARLMRSRGIPTTFFSGQLSADDSLGEFEGVDTPHILEGPRHQAMLRGLYNTKAARALSNWILRNDGPGTVYHVHGWSKVLSPSIFAALRPVADRLAVHAHDFFLTCPNGGYFNFRRMAPCNLTPLSLACLAENCDRRNYQHKLWRSARLALRQALLGHDRIALVFAVHEGMVPLLRAQGLSGANVRVLRNPVTPWATERVPAESNRKLLYVGRLDEDKGVDLLAAAGRMAGVPICFVGDGPLSSMLAPRYPEFEIAGWRDRDAFGEICRDARALVVPSRTRETFGLAALEGLISGIPVIISSHALLAAEIAEMGYGLSCDPTDVPALAACLRRIAHDDVLISRMSHAGLSARKLAPTKEEWGDALIGHYREMLANASAVTRRSTAREACPSPVKSRHA